MSEEVPRADGAAMKSGKPPRSTTQREIDFSKYERVHVALRLLYFGETHDGLARQDSTSNTIEAFLFAALCKLRLTPSPPGYNADAELRADGTASVPAPTPERYSRCGRTDKGVSAFGNCVSLIVRGRKIVTNEGDAGAHSIERRAAATSASHPHFARMLNKVLPPTIRVTAWAPVRDSFDARFACRSRTYRYFFQSPAWSSSHLAFRDLDVGAMRAAAAKLVGTHDFRNLCKMDLVAVRHFVREIKSAAIVTMATAGCAANGEGSHADVASVVGASSPTPPPPPGCHFLEITGNAFLYHQIRCIMAILFMVGFADERPSVVDELLDIARFPRKPCYDMAPPAPLVLWDCEYDVRAEFLPTTDKGSEPHWIWDTDIEAPNDANGSSRLVNQLSDCCLVEISRRAERAAIARATAACMVDCLPRVRGHGSNDALRASSLHVPLMSRPTEASFDEKLARLSGSKKRRRDDNCAKAACGDDTDE